MFENILYRFDEDAIRRGRLGVQESELPRSFRLSGDHGF